MKSSASSLYEEGPWVPDVGDGTYTNPIIHADYSDPDVVRHGEDFFLTSSSFNCTPGLPILHSTDLVNWSIINHALQQLPDVRFERVQHGQGVWAPSIRHHAGKFWIVFPMPDEGIYFTTTTDPWGAWSDPHLIIAGKGLIDPCPLWDGDGKAYLVHAYAGSRAGTRNKIHVRPVTPDMTQILGDGEIVASIDERLPALEGPKWLKRNGWYYISAPSGGVSNGWQTIFRSRNVYGPYQEKVVLAQGDTQVNGPHQGALVDTAEGEWWFIHFQDAGAYGRIVHLQPVRWENDWPLIGIDQNNEGLGKPVTGGSKPTVRRNGRIVVPQTSDDFHSPKLGLQWQWHANHCESWYTLAENPGKLRLNCQHVPNLDLNEAGSLLLQKFPAASFSVETEVTIPHGQFGVHAGLIVMGLEYEALDLSRTSDGYCVRLLTGEAKRHDQLCLKNIEALQLSLQVGRGAVCRLRVRCEGDAWHQIGSEFVAQPGHWIGAKFGLYCLSPLEISDHAFAEFSYCRVLPYPTRPATGVRGMKTESCARVARTASDLRASAHAAEL